MPVGGVHVVPLPPLTYPKKLPTSMSLPTLVVTDGVANDVPAVVIACPADTSTGLDVFTPPNADIKIEPPTGSFVVHVKLDSPAANTCVYTATAPTTPVFVRDTNDQPEGAVNVGCTVSSVSPNPSEATNTSPTCAPAGFANVKLVVDSDTYVAEDAAPRDTIPEPDACVVEVGATVVVGAAVKMSLIGCACASFDVSGESPHEDSIVFSTE